MQTRRRARAAKRDSRPSDQRTRISVSADRSISRGVTSIVGVYRDGNIPSIPPITAPGFAALEGTFPSRYPLSIRVVRLPHCLERHGPSVPSPALRVGSTERDETRGTETSTDRAKFREAFAGHREPIYRFLWRLAGNPHDAEDLLQETFVTFWRKRDQFRGDGSLGGYLRRIAYRTFLNSRSRIAAKNPPLSLDHAPVEPAAEGGEDDVADRDEQTFLLDRVREALATLPDAAREAFVLFRFEGLTVAQVSETMAAPNKTTESRLKRATELLAARLRKHRDLYTTH
ncbi:MAG: RNA polymerase sigma factor [Planctomycetota bacterium]